MLLLFVGRHGGGSIEKPYFEISTSQYNHVFGMIIILLFRRPRPRRRRHCCPSRRRRRRRRRRPRRAQGRTEHIELLLRGPGGEGRGGGPGYARTLIIEKTFCVENPSLKSSILFRKFMF